MRHEPHAGSHCNRWFSSSGSSLEGTTLSWRLPPPTPGAHYELSDAWISGVTSLSACFKTVLLIAA